MITGITVMFIVLIIGISAMFITFHNHLDKIERNIMAKETEVIAELATIKGSLDAANAKLVKIGTETDGLLQKIKDLEEAIANMDDASPELIAAVAAVKESADSLTTALAAQDEKVPDSTPPTT